MIISSFTPMLYTSLLQVQIDIGNQAEGRLPGVTPGSSADPAGGFARFLSGIFSAVMVISALMVLLYLLWGAFDWITAGSESGKTQKARDKMTNAVIGLVVLGAAVAIFQIVRMFLGLNFFSFG
jgi:hypothetical protein